MHFISVLENINPLNAELNPICHLLALLGGATIVVVSRLRVKIYIKTYIKIAPTCFGVRPSSGSLHMSLAEVTFIKSVKVRRYGLCGCVAACCPQPHSP
jgi:hypothetical protein